MLMRCHEFEYNGGPRNKHLGSPLGIPFYRASLLGALGAQIHGGGNSLEVEEQGRYL